MNPIIRLASYARPYLRKSILAVLMLVLVVIVELFIPQLIQRIIDQGIVQKNMTVIVNTSLLLVGVAVMGALLSIGNTLLSLRVAQSYAADLRSALFHRIQSFSFGNMDQFTTGQLMVRLTSDVNMMQMLVNLSLRLLILAPLSMAGSVFFMIMISRELAMIMLIMLPATSIMMWVFAAKALPLFRLVQKKLDNLNQVLQENLAGVRIVKAFVRAEHESKRFDVANTDLTSNNIRVMQLLSILMPAVFLLVNIGTVSILWFGGLQVIADTLTVGEVLAFVNYMFMTIFPLMMLTMMAGQISAAGASAQRIVEVLDTEIEVRNNSDARPLPGKSGRVSFENVSFSYNGNSSEPVLRNIDLVAEAGQTVAVLGATGSGKSSLIHLIPRFYDVTEGRVTLDGVDVRDILLESLRAQVGIALQESVLFSGTIRDNIRYGRLDAKEEEVVSAAKIAQAHDFIMALPDGYDTLVGQRGVNLSGGEKQRIAIARALLVQPRVVILDDSTSSVDVETETKLQNALDDFMKGRTTFIVAQRISTVLKADKIVVLEKGQIVAEGTHTELMGSSPIYREIYDSQLGNRGATQ